MKVLLYTHDPILTLARSKEESLEIYTQEDFNEYAVEIPDKLATELIDTYSRLCELSAAASKYKR